MRYRLDSLTSIRAVAALWVILYHLEMNLSFGFLTPLVRKGYLGVDLFFILSGFVISLAHQRDFCHFQGRKVIEFLVLRLARIMPVHLFILLLYGVSYCSMLIFRGYQPEDEARYPALYYLYSILNIHAWGLTNRFTWNYPSWSVSAEWFAYLLFPFLTLGAGRLASIRKDIALTSILLVGLSYFAQWVGASDINWAINYPLVRVSFEFTIGILLFSLFRQQAGTSWNWDMIAGAIVLAIITGLYANISDFLMIPLFAILIYALANVKKRVKALLSSSFMIHLGEISYSLYMVDAFVALSFTQLAQYIRWPIFSPQAGLVYFAFKLAISLLSAELLYRWVEKPARNWLRDWIKGGSPKLSRIWQKPDITVDPAFSTIQETS